MTPPTRHPKVGVERGCHTFNWDSLTFSFSELTLAFICTIYVITNFFFFLHIYIIHTTIVAFIIFYTPILRGVKRVGLG